MRNVACVCVVHERSVHSIIYTNSQEHFTTIKMKKNSYNGATLIP